MATLKCPHVLHSMIVMWVLSSAFINSLRNSICRLQMDINLLKSTCSEVIKKDILNGHLHNPLTLSNPLVVKLKWSHTQSPHPVSSIRHKVKQSYMQSPHPVSFIRHKVKQSYTQSPHPVSSIRHQVKQSYTQSPHPVSFIHHKQSYMQSPHPVTSIWYCMSAFTA